MGQKTNPNGFRLITRQKHLSNFYSAKAKYPNILEEDYKIRAQIINLFSKYLVLSNIEINRVEETEFKPEFVNIKMSFLYPRKKQADDFMSGFFSYFPKNNDAKNLLLLKYKFKYKRQIYFKSRLRNYAVFIFKRHIKNFAYNLSFKNKKIYSINTELINNIFEDAALIGEYLSEEIKKRIKVRRIIKTIFERVFSLGKFGKILGLKIQLSGRLNGIEMARKEWKRTGNLPLHTLKANIDYSQKPIDTAYGIIGIKIWLFKKFN